MEDAELWQHARSLFHEGLGIAPEDRESFLERVCLDNETLRSELRVLFDSLDEAGDFMEEPAPAAREQTVAPGAMPPDPYEDLEIKPYRLVKCIGRGGMGRVYLAVRADGSYRKRVAVKLLEPGEDSDEIVRRFQDERVLPASVHDGA